MNKLQKEIIAIRKQQIEVLADIGKNVRSQEKLIAKQRETLMRNMEITKRIIRLLNRYYDDK